jgi:hypothetical protein
MAGSIAASDDEAICSAEGAAAPSNLQTGLEGPSEQARSQADAHEVIATSKVTITEARVLRMALRILSSFELLARLSDRRFLRAQANAQSQIRKYVSRSARQKASSRKPTFQDLARLPVRIILGWALVC